MKHILTTCLIFAALCLGTAIGAYVKAADQPNLKPKIYDGIITQINLGDSSFVLRLRDGSLVTVVNPIEVNLFLSVKGVLDPIRGILEKVSEIKMKDGKGSDAIPQISLMNPGSGQVGTSVILNGTGFLKKNNAIWIGDVKYAIIGLPARDGKTITFQIPSAPCNQRIKTACMTSVLPAGSYNIVVSNENGVSNPIPFQVTPLPPLAITTETLPQVVGGTYYHAPVGAIGGAESYIWRVSDGRLPSGLMFAQTVCVASPCRTPGMVSGIPTVPGTYQFTVTLTSGQESISRQFSITVVQPLTSPNY